MIVEIADKFGGKPLRIDASQVIIRSDAGTPVAVAGEYGAAGTISVAHAGEGEVFLRALKVFGYGESSPTIEHMKAGSGGLVRVG